jgi:CHAD domain-containing protein
MSYRIDPRRPLTAEVQRIASAEISAMLRHLAAARDNPDKALHECRKRLKSLRALLGLVRSGDEAFVRAENARYRAIAARLAVPREAAALIETIDRLADAFPDETSGGALDPVRDRLVARRRVILDDEAGTAASVDAALAACRTGIRQIDKLALPDQPESAADVLADGARRTMRRARKALQQAGARGEPDDFHDLRKAVKAHSIHLSLLKKLWPSPLRAQRKTVDLLGEHLGELHDIFVLRALLQDEKQPLGGRAETRLLGRLAKRSERQLRKICLAEASDLFNESPGRTARKLARKAREDLAESAAHPSESAG